MRKPSCLVAVLLALACTAAQAFPDKAITIVVPTSAGGANDVMARIVGQGMAALLKQPVIIDNKAGATGAIAAEAVARAAPDGHTIMLGYVATHGMNPAFTDGLATISVAEVATMPIGSKSFTVS